MYFPPTSVPSVNWSKPVRLAASSMAERPVTAPEATRRPTWASVTVCLPLFVTVPETVTVSPSVGTLGLSESRETSTVFDPVASVSEAFGAASADGAAGS